MTAEFLTCQFCGGDAQTDFIAGESYLIECYACRAEPGIKEAIAAWNRRAEPAAQTNECTRSHPHEEMDAACKRKTIEARVAAQASSAPTINDSLTVPSMTPAEIDDMAFGYAPSAPIGEARELILATISRIQALQNNGEL